MQEPPIPVNEAARLASLVKLDVLDTPPEERFDRITRLAKRMFEVPIALISLIDAERQWSMSKQGLSADESARKDSFCGHAIAIHATADPSHRIMEISDTLQDQRFIDNPFVTEDPHIRFYAGFVLQSHDEYNLGTLCIIDSKPRVLTDEEREAFFDFGMITQNAPQSLRYEDKDLHTGLYNRRGFLSVTDYLLDSCERQKLLCSLVYIELLHYSRLMKQFGSLVEREILAEFVDALKATFRASDVIARIGEDRFVVLVAHGETFKIETLLLNLKQKVKILNTNKNTEFQINYQAGSFSYDPEYISFSGKLIDLVDKRISESNYVDACSLL